MASTNELKTFHDEVSAFMETGGGNVTLQPASTSKLGGVIIGDGLGITSSGKLSLKTASASVKGGVKVGTGLEMNGDTLNCTVTASETFTLKPATEITLGGIKVGTGLSMNGETLNCTVSSGTLSEASATAKGLMSAEDKTKLDGLENYTLTAATDSKLGGVIIGDGLNISTGGKISLQTASATKKGGVKIAPGSGLAMSGDLLYIASGVILGSVPSNIEGEMWYEV